MKDIWSIYEVKLNFINSLCASVPANKELIKTWLEARAPKVRPPGARTISDIQEEVFKTLANVENSAEEQAEESLLVFQKVNGYLAERTSTFRSHIKDCGFQLSTYYIGKIQGEKSFSVRVKNCVYYDETQEYVPILGADGKPVTAASGVLDKPVHATGPRGQPINALKHFEYVASPSSVTFRLKVLGGAVSSDDLETIFIYGSTHGYGGERSDGQGRYSFELKSVSEAVMPKKAQPKPEKQKK